MDLSGTILYYSDMVYAVRINQIIVSRCRPDWTWDVPAGRLADFDLWYVCNGRGWMTVNGQDYPVGRDDCLLLRPRQEIHGRLDPRHPLSVIAVHFDFLDSRRRPHAPARIPAPFQHVRSAMVREMLDRVAWATRPPRAQSDQAAHWLAGILLELLRMNRSAEAPTPAAYDEIHCLCRDIADDPARPWRVHEMASSLGWTSDHFCRVFKAITAVTPGEFVIGSRLEAAKGLLRGSNHSIGQIAQMLGYGDACFFSRQFTARTGTTPRHYRRKTGT